MTDTSAHNTHGTGGRPFNTSGIWELPPTYIQRLIKYTVCFLACRADENARTSCTSTRKALRAAKKVERAERAERCPEFGMHVSVLSAHSEHNRLCAC